MLTEIQKIQIFQIIFKKSKIESGESENENVQKAETQELSIEQTNNDKAKLDKVSKVTKTSGKKKPTNQIKIEKPIKNQNIKQKKE